MELVKITKNSKRIGRGIGSGTGGHTVGRGTKGQKSRSGYRKPRPGFEGGSMPLSRRIPKLRGFSRTLFDNRQTYILTLSDLDKVFENGDIVTKEEIIKKKLINGTSKNYEIKILNNGSLTKKITVEGIKISDSAKKAIIKAGGQVS